MRRIRTLGNPRLAVSDNRNVVLAQALGEYAGLSAILSSVESAWLSAQDQVSRIDSSTWVIVGLIAFGLLFLWNRR